MAFPVTGDLTITALDVLTDETAKYNVTFLNDDNYTVLSAAEYEYNTACIFCEGRPRRLVMRFVP